MGNKGRDRTIPYSFRASLPIMAGYIVLGLGFGLLLQSKGYGWWWATLMSVIVYAGSMQYVAIDLLAGGASLITTALMTVVVNIRHLFYGITMIEKYKGTGRKKPYLIFALTDETFSLVCSADPPENVDRKRYYFFVSMFNQIYWVTGSTIGAVLGDVIPFDTTGVDFSMTALFVIIFVEQWEKAHTHIPALTGIVITVICLLVFGQDHFLIPSMTAITIALFIEKRWIGEKCGEEPAEAGNEKGGGVS
mgnify:CR=1 FL=1